MIASPTEERTRRKRITKEELLKDPRTKEERRKDYEREYYKLNREKINERKSQKIECEVCFGQYSKSHKSHHLATTKHQRAVRMREEQTKQMIEALSNVGKVSHRSASHIKN